MKKERRHCPARAGKVCAEWQKRSTLIQAIASTTGIATSPKHNTFSSLLAMTR